MRRHLLCAALLLLVACDEKTSDGTEIGDEGSGWLCTEAVSLVSDAESTVDALGDSPASLAGAVTGSYSGDSGELDIAVDIGDMSWFDREPQVFEDGSAPDAPEPECVDSLYAGASVDFSAPDLTLSTTVAGISFEADGAVQLRGEALVHQGDASEDPDDDEGGGDEGGDHAGAGSSVTTTLTPSGFTIEDMFRVELVLDGTLVDEQWELELRWLAESYPEGADANVRSVEEVLWTGTVTPAG